MHISVPLYLTITDSCVDNVTFCLDRLIVVQTLTEFEVTLFCNTFIIVMHLKGYLHVLKKNYVQKISYHYEPKAPRSVNNLKEAEKNTGKS